MSYKGIPKTQARFSWWKVIVFIMVILGLYLGGSYIWKNVLHSGFATQDAKEVHRAQENPKLKASELDSSKVYVINKKSDEIQGLEIEVEKVQWRKDSTLVWVAFNNNSEQAMDVMPQMKSQLVDDQGNQYAVKPFDGNNVNSRVMPHSRPVMMLVYEPTQKAATKLTWFLRDVTDMKHPVWSYDIDFDLP